MPLWECPVCHGTYRDPDPSGGVYFHACPPLSVPELLALDRAIVLGLAPELPAAYTRADLERVAFTRAIARPGARDENVRPIVRRIVFAPDPGLDLPVPPRVQDQPPRLNRGD